MIQEYLVNYDYLHRIMEDYGLQVLNRDEAQELGLPDGEGLFSDLFTSLSNKSSSQKKEFEQYKEALNMNEYEKKISFLNKYVVYKKVRIVNTQKVILEEAEESDEMLIRKEHNSDV